MDGGCINCCGLLSVVSRDECCRLLAEQLRELDEEIMYYYYYYYKIRLTRIIFYK
jgi:hypothetical protein